MRECEEMLKIVQRSWNSRLDLEDVEHVPSMPEVEVSCQLKHYKIKSTDWPFNYLATGTRDSVKPRVQAASQLCFEKLESSYSILTLV